MSSAFGVTPLYSALIGVDRVVAPFETALRAEASASYPPYDIEKTGQERYRISPAAPDFSPTDLQLFAESNILASRGGRAASQGQDARTFMHQGLAQRALEGRLELADHVVLKGAVDANGALAREAPDALKSNHIHFAMGASQQALEDRSAQTCNAA